MRILLIHNKYKQAGGEDSVFRSESDLLFGAGHVVEHMLYDNSRILTIMEKCLSGLKTIYNPDSAWVIRRRVLEFQPDIIHVHNFLPLVSPSVFFVAKQFDIPVILTLHNYRLICPSATLFHNGHLYEGSIFSIFPWKAIWEGVYRSSRIQTAAVVLMTAFHHLMGTWKYKIAFYIALTEFAREKFEHSAISLPSDKLFVKPNFAEDCGQGNLKRENYFLFIGRLTEEKGIHMLLKASSLYSFKLVIIGDGPLRQLVEKSASTNSNISYLGFQPKAIVISYLKRCTALIFPSIWYEGFPVTILEAFSTGTPVIASNLGGMKEIIEDGENGMHFEAGNARDLILKIIEITQDSKLASKLSANARSSYLKLYTPQINYNQLINIYDKAIGVGKREALKKIAISEVD